MSMESIRAYYKVPAKRGGRVRYRNFGHPVEGTTTGTTRSQMYINVRLDGKDKPMSFHPTWDLEYL